MAQTERRPEGVLSTAPQGNAARNVFLIIILALLWGSSFMLMKQGLKAFTAQQVASFRIFIAFVSLLPIYLRIDLKGLKKQHFWGLLVVALFGSGIPPYLFTWAQTHIASYVAGVLNALTPLMTLMFGYVLFRNVVKGSQVLGVLVGFLGASLVILLRADMSFDQDMEYSLLVVLAAACYGIGANTLKAKLSELSPFTITTLAFTIIGPFAGIYLWYTGAFRQIVEQQEAQVAVGYLLILGVVGTAFALILFNYLIKTVSALYASTVTYLIPIVALFWGVLDGEQIGIAHLAGLALILAGIKLTGK